MEEQIKSTKKAKKQVAKNYTYAVGRRKEATARVRLYKSKTVPGSDRQIIINDRPAEHYFPGSTNQARLMEPLKITETANTFSASAKVKGSGISGQRDAVVHGIARALAKLESDFKAPLKRAGLLTRDSRAKERRKVGTGGKARRQKQSPKR